MCYSSIFFGEGQLVSIMIYRGPGFLAVVRFGSSPTLLPHLSSVSSTATHRKTEKEKTCCQERGERGGRGAESYDRKKVLVLYKSFNTLWHRGTETGCYGWEVGKGGEGGYGSYRYIGERVNWTYIKIAIFCMFHLSSGTSQPCRWPAQTLPYTQGARHILNDILYDWNQ